MRTLNYKKVLLNVIIVIGTLCLVVGFLYYSIARPAFDINYYKMQFEKNGTAENIHTDEVSLEAIMQNIIDYLAGNSETMQIEANIDGEPTLVFDNDELSHMEDVKTLFVGGRDITIGLFVVFVICAIILGFNNKYYMTKGYKIALKTFAFVFVCGIVLSIIAVLDFDGAFTIFHSIFFPQGNWQFSYYSILIRMLPESLFYDITVLILVRLIALTLFTVFCNIIASKIYRNNEIKNNLIKYNSIKSE